MCRGGGGGECDLSRAHMREVKCALSAPPFLHTSHEVEPWAHTVEGEPLAALCMTWIYKAVGVAEQDDSHNGGGQNGRLRRT